MGRATSHHTLTVTSLIIISFRPSKHSELAPLYDSAVPRPVLRALMTYGSPYTAALADGGVEHPVDFKVRRLRNLC